MGNSLDMGPLSLAWSERLDRLRERATELQRDAALPAQLPLERAEREFARLRAATRPLLESTATAFETLTPAGYPRIEDNGIPGPGGSLGLRFSVWHAFHVAFEHAKKPRSDDANNRAAAERERRALGGGGTGLAGALAIRVKRMPGDPLPPRDPNERFELSIQALRWDADRGWVEVRRVLPECWTVQMVAEQLEAYLAGFAYDVAAGLPAR